MELIELVRRAKAGDAEAHGALYESSVVPRVRFEYHDGRGPQP